MQTLQIDPPIPFIVPDTTSFTVVLCGCGGTGSHLAYTLARLAAHCRDTGGPRLTLAFVDGDTVERKNVGRQLFAPADVGKNKAMVLAARLNAVFGLDILVFPRMLTGETLRSGDGYGILVGAVDNARARLAIRNTLHNLNLGQQWRIWLDLGNHESSGQVVCGTAGCTVDRKSMGGAIQHGMCSRLPVASVLYPELLDETPLVPRADCAAAMQDNAQSLMVNQTMAAIAGQYLYDLVVRRRLTRFRTVVDLDTLTMRSDPITAAALAQACGLTTDQVLGIKPKKQRRKAA